MARRAPEWLAGRRWPWRGVRRRAPDGVGLLAVGLVALGGAVALAVAVLVFPYHSVNHDEAVYLQQAAGLLRGRLFLHPPVPGAFRPWFYVASPRGLYPRYAPYPAALDAVGMALGSARLTLAAVGAAVVGLTYLLGREVDGRATGVIAAAFVCVSPLFVVDVGTFLPYAPVAVLDLGFALAYLRAERTGSTRAATLAGASIGLAFFARPYTAVCVAAPFVAHACWTLWRSPDRRRVRRRVATAALGLVGVAAALAYNWLTTGHPLVFPFEAFAPADGIGFGPHALRGYGVDYTPALALRSNAVVVWQFASRWVAGGLLGSALAAVGLWRAARRGRSGDARLFVLAGLYPSVVVGNVFFWGNDALLGPGLDPARGLLAYLGPYYHFDLLAPTAVFAALGARWLLGRGRRVFADRDRRVAVAVVALVAVLVVAAVGGALAGPLARNAANTDQYRRGYAPFEAGGPPADAVVFLPTPYGPWLNHPFQALRNDPGFDGSTVYALDGPRALAVAAAYPNRTYYRYEYRGTWVPTDGRPVHPALERVRVTRGDSLVENLTVRVPPGADAASVRVATDRGHGYYALNATPGRHALALAVRDGRLRVDGAAPVGPNATRELPLAPHDQVVATVYVETAPSVGVGYRSRTPVGYVDGTRAALTPYLEVCTDPHTCGGGAAAIPGRVPAGYDVNATLRPGSA